MPEAVLRLAMVETLDAAEYAEAREVYEVERMSCVMALASSIDNEF
jgi:hypothetical protein